MPTCGMKIIWRKIHPTTLFWSILDHHLLNQFSMLGEQKCTSTPWSVLKTWWVPSHAWQLVYPASSWNPAIRSLNFQTFKYGVVTHEDLLIDLFDWDTLYLSGRLHKPVHFLYPVMDRTLARALRLNLESAARAALIKLPAAFSEREFYHSIVGLSYGGSLPVVLVHVEKVQTWMMWKEIYINYPQATSGW